MSESLNEPVNNQSFEQMIEQSSDTQIFDATKAAGVAVGSMIEKPVPPASTSLRTGYWSRPTSAQIDNAAKYGFDLTKQDKYFS